MSATLTDRARIDSVLNRSRRRLTLAETWANVSIALASALLAGEVLFAFGLRRFILPTVAVAVAAALIRAARRRPAAVETASTIDRRLGLQDRLIAATQFRDGNDPLAQLVARDAAAALRNFRPSDVLRVTTPRAAIALCVAALAMPLAVVTVTGQLQSAWTPGLGGATAQSGAQIGSASATSIASQTRTAAASAQASSDSPGRDAEPAVARMSAAVAARPATGATDARAHEDGLRKNRGNRDSAATTRDAAASSSPRAGGVASGQLSEAAARPLDEASDAASANRAAWSRAQSAVAANRIPAERRELVRRYFEAVRPPEPR